MAELDEKSKQISRLFVDNLITARRNKGLTQRQVAAKLGISASTIGCIEARVGFPRFSLFFRLCSLYEVEPKALFDGRIQQVTEDEC